MRGPRRSATWSSRPSRRWASRAGVPGIPDSIFAPENFVFPVFDYDWGPHFDEFNATGVPTNVPPPIQHVIKMMVPRVDADGNELGGVPTVPLGIGWNITASGCP